MRTLYQFAFSHFCEKARWALELKGLQYQRRNLLPGLHLRTTQTLAQKSSLPILVDGDRIIQDSTRIISYLDEQYPARSLTPIAAADAARALEWEAYLGKEVGVPLRQWAYYHLLPDRTRVLRLFGTDGPWYAGITLKLLYPQLRRRMTRYMNLQEEPVRQAEARLLAAFDHLDRTLEQQEYLVGNSFSRADLTACALLNPYCLVDRAETEINLLYPQALIAHRSRNRQRRFFRWVEEVYRKHRRRHD